MADGANNSDTEFISKCNISGLYLSKNSFYVTKIKPYLQTAPGSLLRFMFKEEKVIPPTETLLERYKPAM